MGVNLLITYLKEVNLVITFQKGVKYEKSTAALDA